MVVVLNAGRSTFVGQWYHDWVVQNIKENNHNINNCHVWKWHFFIRCRGKCPLPLPAVFSSCDPRKWQMAQSIGADIRQSISFYFVFYCCRSNTFLKRTVQKGQNFAGQRQSGKPFLVRETRCLFVLCSPFDSLVWNFTRAPHNRERIERSSPDEASNRPGAGKRELYVLFGNNNSGGERKLL